MKRPTTRPIATSSAITWRGTKFPSFPLAALRSRVPLRALSRKRRGGRNMPIIYAQPYEYTFQKNRLALVIIDMQRDFIEPGGFGAALGNDVSLLAPIIPAVVELLHAFRKLGL